MANLGYWGLPKEIVRDRQQRWHIPSCANLSEPQLIFTCWPGELSSIAGNALLCACLCVDNFVDTREKLTQQEHQAISWLIKTPACGPQIDDLKPKSMDLLDGNSVSKVASHLLRYSEPERCCPSLKQALQKHKNRLEGWLTTYIASPEHQQVARIWGEKHKTQSETGQLTIRLARCVYQNPTASCYWVSYRAYKRLTVPLFNTTKAGNSKPAAAAMLELAEKIMLVQDANGTDDILLCVPTESLLATSREHELLFADSDTIEKILPLAYRVFSNTFGQSTRWKQPENGQGPNPHDLRRGESILDALAATVV